MYKSGCISLCRFGGTGCWAGALRKSIRKLSVQLTAEYGGGFDFSRLYKYLRLYRVFPILDTLCTKSGKMLSWSHSRTLLQVSDPLAREWYLNEAAEQTWGVRMLQRNISSQYYQRMRMSRHRDAVKREMLEITRPLRRIVLCQNEQHFNTSSPPARAVFARKDSF